MMDSGEMGGNGDKIIVGGEMGVFHTTQWTHILQARMLDESQRRKVIDALTTRYWNPVYYYLRRKGYEHEDASDLTQGFFCEIVLGRDIFYLADKSKGKFRTFLLTALDRYLIGQHRREKAQKRGGGHRFASFEQLDLENQYSVESSAAPEHSFLYGWATDILDGALKDLEREYIETDRRVYWDAFYCLVVNPIMTGKPPPSLRELCSHHNIETRKKASNIVTTAKRRFRTLLKQRIMDTGIPEDKVEEELQDLILILSRDGAA